MDFVSTCTIPLEEYNRLKNLEADYKQLEASLKDTKKTVEMFIKPFITLDLPEEAMHKLKEAIEDNRFTARIETDKFNYDPLHPKTNLLLYVTVDGEFHRK